MAGGGLDTVRWLHDSLAFLTEFFASFAVGALQTVGPYSNAIKKLMEQPPSLDRSERLLAQAFTDWKAHPHHPAYESLRETFFLTSRLQTSRFAPRRHARWLGVEGRAVAGVERLPRWSRRIDLVVSGGDEQAAHGFIETYTPLLWTWTDSLQGFFSGWAVTVQTEVKDGRIGLAGSASRNDVRLELVPVDVLSGLKSSFGSDGNGGILLEGFRELGGPGQTSQPVPEAAPVSPSEQPSGPVSEERPPLDSDPHSDAPEPQAQISSVGEEAPLFAQAPQSVEAPLFAPAPGAVRTDDPLTRGTKALLVDQFRQPTPEQAEEAPASGTEAAPAEPAQPDHESSLFNLSAPTAEESGEAPTTSTVGESVSVEPAPDLGSPSEPVAEIPAPDFGDEPVTQVPAPDFGAGPVAEIPAPDFGTDSIVPVPGPDMGAPIAPPTETSAPNFGAESVDDVPAPDFGAEPVAETPAPDFSAPTEPGAEAPTADFGASLEPVAEVSAPDFGAVSEPVAEVPAPNFGAEPVAEVRAPDFGAEPVDEVPAPDFGEPAEPVAEVRAPDFGAEPVDEVPAPDFGEPAEPVAEVPAPDFSAPAEPVAEVPAPDFGVEPVDEVPAPDFGEPAEPVAEVPAPDFGAEPVDEVPAPDFGAPAEPVAEVPAPDFSAPAEPVAEVPAPDFGVEPVDEVPAPDFGEPAEPVAEVPAPDFGAEPVDEVPAPDFGAPAEPVAEVPAPEESVDEVPAPDFGEPGEPVAEVPAPDFGAEPVDEVPAPDFGAPAESVAEVSAPDFGAEPVDEVPAPDFVAPAEPAADVPAPGFSAPAEPVAEVPAPDFGAEPADEVPTPDFGAPAEPVAEAPTPDFSSPAEPVAEVPALDFSAPAEPVAEVPAPDFGAESADEVPAPNFGAPVAEVPAPDFSAPTEPVAEIPGPDFSSPAEPVAEVPPSDFTARAEPVAEVSAPDFGSSSDSVEEVPTPDFGSPEDDSAEGLPYAVDAPQTVEVPAVDVEPSVSEESVPAVPEPTVEVSLPSLGPENVAPTLPPVEPEATVEVPLSVPVSTGDDIFALNEDQEDIFAQDPDSASKPLFPSDAETVPSSVSAEPEPQFTSVEIEVPADSIRDMGAAAEEILEDNYDFSPEDGPAKPKWKGWSVDEREAVQEVCEFVVGQSESVIPEAYGQPVRVAIESTHQKIQVLLERCCGKTRLAQDLSLQESSKDSHIALLASWEKRKTDGRPGTELLRFYYELRRSKRSQRGQLALPEPQAVTALATSADKEGFGQAFQRLLGQISSLNKKPLLFILDEPPELVREALALNLSSGVRFLSILEPQNSLPALGEIVDLRPNWKAAAEELFGETASNYKDRPDANLLRLAMANELVNSDYVVPQSLAEVEEMVVKSEIVDTELLAVLSLEERAISLDDLDQWFLDAEAVTETITAFPSIFELAKTRLSPVLGLAHPSVTQRVIEQYASERSSVAKKLLGWVVLQLERTNAEKYGGLQVREIVFRNFLRLYRFAKLSNDPDILEWVLRNKDLQRRRVVLTSHLEKPGSRYELSEMLETLVELLTELVNSGKSDDLRDELAWAHSNLALNQLKLGLYPQAAEHVEIAFKLFETLVNKEKQYEFRSALSTSQYRASRIYDAMGVSDKAVEFADAAVQGFVDLVEDRGKTELTPRLGLALAHRGRLFSQADKDAAAKTDLQRAATLLENNDQVEPGESFRTLVDIQLELVTIFMDENDLDSAIKEAGKAVKTATVALEEHGMEEFQPILATCHGLRAKCYQKQNEPERAQRDIVKSISLRNLSVDEGRLEQRYFLAKDLQLRAQIDQLRGAGDDATRDLGQAIELLQKLAEEGRADANSQLLVCLLDRANIFLGAGKAQEGVADLQRSLTLAEKDNSAEAGVHRAAIQDSLLQAYVKNESFDEALAISQSLLADYHAAQAWEKYSKVQLIRGSAFEKKGDRKQAHESYTQAANLLSQLLAQGQTEPLLVSVAEAYLGLGGLEMVMGRSVNAQKQIKQAIDVYSHLFQQRGRPDVLPLMLKSYSLMAAANLAQDRVGEAKQALKSGFDILKYMDSSQGKNGIPTSQGLENLKGQLHRLRAQASIADGDPGAALNDTEEATRNFLATRGRPDGLHWKDEFSRNQILRSKVFFALKDFNQAENSIQESIAHFDEKIREGRYEYFGDLITAMGVKADNSAKAGKIDQVLEEYQKMLATTTTAAKAGASIDGESEMAKILEKRARVYRDQGLLNEAYADYESVIGLYRNLVTNQGRGDLALELVRIHLERGEMTTKAGHGQHAINDFSESINVAKALVGQGQASAVPELARALHSRADVLKNLGRAQDALADLQGCIGFRSQLAQQSQDPELLGSLGKAFLAQGTILMQAGHVPQAAQSLDQANVIFTNLVEGQGLREFSSELAQGLIQRVSLSSDKSDPALRQVLIKAVDLVNSQAKEGRPIAKEFTIECLRTVVELLQREDFETVGHLIDSVLQLVETVVTDGRSEQDFVKLTDLLLAASAGLIDDRRTARRPHFLSLACVSCNREIQMFGKNSLPRLVYCLYELGQALERSKAPAVLNYVGSSFALLGELAVQQQSNEDFLRELKMMVSTWRSLPPQIPALANVSRHMLSQLLRLT